VYAGRSSFQRLGKCNQATAGKRKLKFIDIGCGTGRFIGATAGTNPEELLGAVHAAWFTCHSGERRAVGSCDRYARQGLG
jgi:hypothetical protein